MRDMVEQARTEVRFALSQLSARNGQHEFETMTRTLARATVTRNILPATGPVAAGGDQGRDFETFRADLAGQTRRLGRQIGIRDRDGVAFSCTLQQEDVGSKIRGDVDAIMAEGTRVDYVLAYCEVNIPTARRHKYQRQVRAQHGIHLEIFDGNAISDLLADNATFWIAEQYLHLPGRALPPPPDRPGWYEADLERWHARTTPATTWGDFVDLKGCLQYAYLTREGREDIPFWLEQLAPLLTDGRSALIRHAARHQTVLASHLGLGSMHTVDQMVAEEISLAVASHESNLLADAATLLLLTCAAYARNETGHTDIQIMSWNRGLTERVEHQLTSGPHSGDRCLLLETLAALKMQPDLEQATADGGYRAYDATTDFTVEERLEAVANSGLTPIGIPAIDRPGAINAFVQLSAALADAPLYPVEHACKFLTLHAPLLIDEPEFESLVDVLDRRLADSVGDDAAADKALDRVTALFNVGRILDGLRHLHRARLGLLHGEAGSRLIHATLATAEAYQRLQLFAAAKYYGLVAASLIRRDDMNLLPQCLFKAAAADYHQGNWVSSTLLNRAALSAHSVVAEQAEDVEQHPWLPAAMFELTNTKALADKLGAPYKPFVDDAIDEAGVSLYLDAVLNHVGRDGPPWWEELDADQLIARGVQQLGCVPFGDAGPQRVIRFQVLGVTWTVEFANQQPDVAIGERFAAALQITLAHLSAVDLVLLPTSARILVTPSQPGTDLMIDQVDSSPSQTSFHCTLATINDRNQEAYNDALHQTLAAVATVIITISTLSDELCKAVLDQAFEQGLPSLIMFTMPYDIALETITSSDTTRQPLDERQLLADPDAPGAAAGPGLEFPTTPGLHYSRSHSHDEVRFRYDHLPTLMRPTLAALRQTRTFANTVATLRERGWLDWHILLAVHVVAKNARMRYRTRLSTDDLEAVRSLFLSPEPDNDPVPESFFTVAALELALDATIPANAVTTWDFALRQRSIDVEATRRLLGARYGWNDDIAHDDPFDPAY